MVQLVPDGDMALPINITMDPKRESYLMNNMADEPLDALVSVELSL